MKPMTNETLRSVSLEMMSRMLKQIVRYGATHVLLARNEDFSSSQFGAQTFAMCGPRCTIKTPEDADGKHLNDLPSLRQHFVEQIEVTDMATFISRWEAAQRD